MVKRLNVAVIGVGFWGKHIISGYAQLAHENNRVKLFGACDVSDENLAFCKRFNVPFLTKDFKELIKNPDIDVVHICAPSEVHYVLCRFALEYRKHVIVEKPIANNTHEAMELYDLANKKKLVLSVGHIYRFSPAIIKVKNLIQRGFFGDLYWMKLHWTNPPLTAMGLDVLNNLTIHPFDILNFLTDELPMKVTCVAEAQKEGREKDIAHITFQYRKSPITHIEVGWLHPEKLRELQIMGSEKFATIDCLMQTIKIRDIHNTANSQFRSVPVKRTDIVNQELLHFIKCVHQSPNPALFKRNNAPIGALAVFLVEIARSTMVKGRTMSVMPIESYVHKGKKRTNLLFKSSGEGEIQPSSFNEDFSEIIDAPFATKENTVIVFGHDSDPQSLSEMFQVRDYLKSKNYESYLLKELPDHPLMSNEEKARYWALASRFCVMIDRSPSGHIAEYIFLREDRVILAFLRPKDKGSTYMIGDESIERENIRLFEFGNSPIRPLDEAIIWAEKFAEKKIAALKDAYPWRK
jgi:UDP-N-acetylglucosamine 3-dehydrogenase